MWESRRESSRVPDRLLMCSIVMLLYQMWLEGQQAPPVLVQSVTMYTCAVQPTRSPHEPLSDVQCNSGFTCKCALIVLTPKSSGGIPDLIGCSSSCVTGHRASSRSSSWFTEVGLSFPKRFCFFWLFLYDVDMIDAGFLLNDFNCSDTSPFNYSLHGICIFKL